VLIIYKQYFSSAIFINGNNFTFHIKVLKQITWPHHQYPDNQRMVETVKKIEKEKKQVAIFSIEYRYFIFHKRTLTI